VQRGDLVPLSPRVLAVAGSPDTTTRRALAATLDAAGALSHHSAAAWRGLPGFQVEPLHVTRLRGGHTRSTNLATVHEPRSLAPAHLTEWRGVTVTRPARTLFDLAAIEHPGRVERALDTSWARGLVTITALDGVLADLAARGRSGITTMRGLIDERRSLPQPAGSRLERRTEELIRRAGLPPFRRQVDAGDEVGWIGRVDLVAPDRAFLVEVDSDLHHSALSDVRRDRSRVARLRTSGWEVLQLHEAQVWHEAVECTQLLRAGYLRARPR
jgi:very-short-patch-repair endonuclease